MGVLSFFENLPKSYTHLTIHKISIHLSRWIWIFGDCKMDEKNLIKLHLVSCWVIGTCCGGRRGGWGWAGFKSSHLNPVYSIHAISHTVRQNLTEFSPYESQFPEEFSNLTEFLDKFLRDFMKSKHKLHFIVSIRSLFKLTQGFKIPLGSLKAIFVKVSQNFYQISLKILPNLTDFSSQLMTCML